MIIGFTFSLEEFPVLKFLFRINRNQRAIIIVLWITWRQVTEYFIPSSCGRCYVINSVLFNSSLMYGPAVPPPVVVISTGSNCVSDCTGKADGDYQSCTSCNVYVSCSNERLYDNRPCAPSTPALVWDDNKKRCEYSSPTWYVTH